MMDDTFNETDEQSDFSFPIITFDNSGHNSLRVPGFNDIPIHYELPCDARFAHGIVEWRQAPAVTARELAMVAVMDQLTDRPDWHLDIFNKQVVVDEWRKEAFASTPLMSERAWAWCVKELQDKAIYFREQNSHVRVLDIGSCVCKSDTATLSSLSEAFRREVLPVLLERRQQQQQEEEDEEKEQEQGNLYRRSSSRILHLVDPLLYPLTYGKSLVLTDGGKVDLHNILGSYNNATVAPKHFDRRVDAQDLQKLIDDSRDFSMGISPMLMEGQESGTEVHITSYINNLHPAHQGLYQAIEKLVSLAIKPWNDCLVKGQRGWHNDMNNGQLGPVPLRIITHGVEWVNKLPEWALAFRVPSESEKRQYYEAQEMLQSSKDDPTEKGRKKYLQAQKELSMFTHVAGKEDMELPPPDSDLWQKAKEYLELPEDESNIPVKVPDDWAQGLKSPWDMLRQKVKRVIRFKHPEPGTAFSYEDWKAGRHNDKAIIDIVRHRKNWPTHGRPFQPVIPPHTPYKITLQDIFRKQGLQVIVKMENIELTPQTPNYSSDTWQLEGQLNQHIAAVAVFAYDVVNITKARIAFRQYTSLHGCFYQYSEERYKAGVDYDWRNLPAHRYGTREKEYGALTAILGFSWRDLSIDYHGTRSYQCTGSVATPQGRLVTFPSVLEHRVEPFQLADPTRPGHYRYIKLYLVDPHYRVCSTRNVPPQQHHWWAQEVGNDLTSSAGLPRELVDGILKETDSWPIGVQEARQHRQELSKEHFWNERRSLFLSTLQHKRYIISSVFRRLKRIPILYAALQQSAPHPTHSSVIDTEPHSVVSPDATSTKNGIPKHVGVREEPKRAGKLFK
ncbi:uncharacterized protein N7482_010724 [Penicillium canariense]|uniref:Uncharacterized protein n=1 Tax=Penicillium canariense TaxID=189055 RepID=A0A9W9HL64_9EURO|nr:uncharacterized protein N7482_010724 [Penicillium canariense]KAJ5151472.1 hypothetical protein N7482_010724 [Penicillium canariense]